MAFLLAKILGLLVLAALCGAWLARWYLRRTSEDVTLQYRSLQDDWASWRKDIEAAVRGIRMPAPVATDLTPVMNAIAAIRMPEIPPAREPNLGPLAERMMALELRVAAIRMPEIPPPREPDLAPLAGRLAALEQRIGALRMPEIPPAREPDLAPLAERLAALEQRIGALRMPEIPPPREPDLAPLHARLDGMERAIVAIRMPEIPPPPPPTDLEPVQQRLAAIESALAQLAAARAAAEAVAEGVMAEVSAPAAAAAPPARRRARTRPRGPGPALVRPGSRNLLRSAAYGRPDDLKEIVGVARVLERMLHRIGVYYFWQVAEWSPADVAYVDTQLEAFRGRIGRDGWVRQASQLMRGEGAARRPG